MFENNVFLKDSCKNVVENGEIIGYEMKTHIIAEFPCLW